MPNDQPTSDAVPSLTELQTSPPVTARRVFRQGFYFKKVTSGLCRGYIQANLAGVHGSFADDFVEFCRANAGALPLLHHSKPGDFSAGPLAEDSDARTDVSAYNVLKHGEYVDVVPDLLPYGDVLNEYAFFYTGCSFSFDKILLDAGIHLEYADNPDITVSMYTTNVQCHTVGSIQGPMVVSMRPVPRHLVQVAVRATNPLPDIHGAPIHIGDFDTLGIKDMYKVDYGDPPSPLKKDHIPVFWACGNTIKEILKHSKHPLSFTMYSDCMYLSDNPSDDESTKLVIPDGQQPVVVDMVDEPYQASLVSEDILDKLNRLQNSLKEHFQGLCDILKEDTFMTTVLTLSHSSSIAIAVSLDDDGIGSNFSGFMGTIAVAKMFRSLGKDVTFVADPGKCLPLNKITEVLSQSGFLQDSIKVVQCPDATGSTLSTLMRRFDHLVTLQATEDFAQLFMAAKELNMFTSQGIGTHEAASQQQCLLDAYGYAISIALYLLATCPVHDRYRRRSVGFPPSDRQLQSFKTALPTAKAVTDVLEILENRGFLSSDTDAVWKRNLCSTLDSVIITSVQ